MTEARLSLGRSGESLRGSLWRSLTSFESQRGSLNGNTPTRGARAMTGQGAPPLSPAMTTPPAQRQPPAMSATHTASSLALSSDTVCASDVAGGSAARTDDSGVVVEAAVATPLLGRASASAARRNGASSEWCGSLDFAQQLDEMAERELQTLWAELWMATHSEAELEKALQSRRTHWNPYRPARGGPEVRAEILRSEVVEFQAMVPTDNLYLAGTALGRAASSSPARGRGSHARGRGALATEGAVDNAGDEEVLVADTPVASPTSSTAAVHSVPCSPSRDDAPPRQQQQPHSPQHAESETALFRYLWEAVVVPFYAAKPAAFFTNPPPGERRTMDTSASFVSLQQPRFEERDDREATEVVTAFDATQDEVPQWSNEPRRRSFSPPLLPGVMPAKSRKSRSGLSGAADAAREMRGSSAGVSRVLTSDTLGVGFDDSLEVEVLDESQERARSEQRHTSSPPPKGRDGETGTGAKDGAVPAQRSSHRRLRPSTAGVQGPSNSPMDGAVAERRVSGSKEELSPVANRRAASARSDSVRNTGVASTAPRSTAAARSPGKGVSGGSDEAPVFAKRAGAGSATVLGPYHGQATKCAVAMEELEVPTPPRSSWHQRPPTSQPRAARFDQATAPAMATQSEADTRPAQSRNGIGSATGKSRGTRGSAVATLSKGPLAVRSSARGTRTRATAAEREAMLGSANGSAQRALQLLEMHSRSALRSPPGPRNASPVFQLSADAPRRELPASSTEAESTLSHPQRHGLLSPMELPARGKRRRNPTSTRQPAEADAGHLLGTGGAKKASAAKPRLGPLREVADRSASTERQRPSVLVPPGAAATYGVAPATRNTSVGSRRQSKQSQQGASKLSVLLQSRVFVMSTLTVCPHCGDATRFDAMKAHLDACTERSPLTHSRHNSPTTLPAPAAVKPISGLDFYNQLNKLSRLTRPSRSASRDRPDCFGASPLRDEAAVVQRLMYPPNSLTIDVAPPHPPTSVETLQPPPPSWAAVSAVPPPEAPSIQVNLRSRSPESGSRSMNGAAPERSASTGRVSDVFSKSPSLASLSARGRAPSGSQHATTNGTAAAAAGHRTLSRSASNGSHRQTLASLHGFVGAVDAASLPNARPSPSAHRNTVAAAAMEQESGLPSTIADLSENASMRGATLEHDGRSAQQPVPRTSESSVVSSTTSSRRRPPQQSSFAIRLRGDSAGPIAHLHASAQPVEDTSTVGSAAQLQALLRQVQQILRQQQVQYTALLQAHGDLHRQVAAQQGAYGSLLRRSMDQAAVVEAALAQHSQQWRREEAAVQESVSSLWATVSELQARLQSVAAPSPAKALTAPHAAQSTVIAAASAPSTPQGRPPRHDVSTHRSPAERLAANGANTSDWGSEWGSQQEALMASALSGGAGRRRDASAMPIRVQRHSTAEAATQESAYYSDMASFILSDTTAASSWQAALLSSQPVAPPAVTRPTVVPADVFNAAAVGGGQNPAPPLALSASFSSNHDSGFAVPQPPAVSMAAPQPSPYAVDVLQQQQQKQQMPLPRQHSPPQSRSSMEDRVIAKLHGKPTAVVHHFPWR